MTEGNRKIPSYCDCMSWGKIVFLQHQRKRIGVMKNQKMYEADDSMISLIRDNYSLLQSLGCFGINLGFGDKTVSEVCEEQGVDTYTYLAVVNFIINGYRDFDDVSKLSIPTLMQYLKASHEYFLGFQLPSIRTQLVGALDENDNLARLILKLYDDYARAIRSHMKYEEKTVFPYVEALLGGEPTGSYDIETYSKHHGHNNEEWLSHHADVEESVFIPAIRRLERKIKQSDVSAKISSMISQNGESNESLSEREKDVIVSLVQGMSNKEIADHLCISINTVITHRRNIARKLQIHSPAGLTIYAIVNHLVDISSVKL